MVRVAKGRTAAAAARVRRCTGRAPCEARPRGLARVRPRTGVVQPARQLEAPTVSRRVASLLPIAVAVALVGSAAPSAAVLDGADTTPPTITPTVTGTSGAGGWYTSAVSVSWSGCRRRVRDRLHVRVRPGHARRRHDRNHHHMLGDERRRAHCDEQRVRQDRHDAPGGEQVAPSGRRRARAGTRSPSTSRSPGATRSRASRRARPSSVYSGPDSKNASVGGRARTAPDSTAPAVASFKYDASPPAIAAHLTGTQGANGWFTSDVSVSWDVSDPHSESPPPRAAALRRSRRHRRDDDHVRGTNDAGLTGQASVQVQDRQDCAGYDDHVRSERYGRVVGCVVRPLLE